MMSHASHVYTFASRASGRRHVSARDRKHVQLQAWQSYLHAHAARAGAPWGISQSPMFAIVHRHTDEFVKNSPAIN